MHTETKRQREKHAQGRREIDTHTETDRQTPNCDDMWYHLHVESKKIIQMNLLTKQK